VAMFGVASLVFVIMEVGIEGGWSGGKRQEAGGSPLLMVVVWGRVMSWHAVCFAIHSHKYHVQHKCYHICKTLWHSGLLCHQLSIIHVI
jgi:hypothetical protein